MLLILDSNEYIFALGTIRDPSCGKLFDELSNRSEDITVRLTRLIIEEVRNNLISEAFREFIILINKMFKIS